MTSVTKLRFSGEELRMPLPTAHERARAILKHWIRAATTPQRVARRSRIVLAWLEGRSVDQIAASQKVSKATVRLWVSRFERGGSDALLHDAPGRGRRPVLDASTIRERLAEAKLLDDAGDPVSLRRAAKFLRVSLSSLWRALRRRGTSQRDDR
jgi:transposase